MKFLAVKVPKNNEYTHEQSMALFSSLVMSPKKSGLLNIFSKKQPSTSYSFNILSAKQRINFIVVTEDQNVPHLTNQILAQYSKSEVTEVPSFKFKTPYVYELQLAKDDFLPFRTMESFAGVDPLASLLSAISRSTDPKAVYWLQIILTPAPGQWQTRAISSIDALSKVPENSSQSQQNKNQIALIHEKVKHYGFNVNIRLLSDTQVNLDLFNSAFTIFAQPSGNSFVAKKPSAFKKEKLLEAINNHQPYGKSSLLNILELSTLWHLPTALVNVPNIVWGKRLTLDTPENLPIAQEMPEEQKKNSTFVAKTNYKNQEQVFGIKELDRLRHMYIVGKSGTGKSTLLANMAIEDIRKGAGVAVLDPHGDTIENILKYIPKKRINDVCYFNPADPEYAYPLNILDIPNPEQKELMVSGIISIFYKLYSHSWGPRLEYILRNVLFTLASAEGTNLGDILNILLNKDYRKKVLSKVNDPYILQYWEKEFDKMDPKQLNEAISPILNKVGQFITSPLIRRVIAHQKSKVKIEEIMNSGKILLCDLSQGKIGEDNATLLGSMIITLIQISALNRANQNQTDRKPFFLHVDEFQNFATSAFIKILSEARKYGLSLTLANQYISQIDPAIIQAILGNVGTLMTFNIGAQDADILSKEFGTEISPEDLSALEKFQIVLRLGVDGMASPPFMAKTLPLPKNISGHEQKVIEASRRRYGVKIK